MLAGDYPHTAPAPAPAEPARACQRESGITSARGETQRGDGTQVRVSIYILWSNKILQLEFRIQTVEPAASMQQQIKII